MRNPWEILRKMVLSTATIRNVDRRAIEHFGMESLVLMENAASNCARWIVDHFPDRPTTAILCGSGNNGGDGVVLARHLATLGWPCVCFVQGPLEKLSSDNLRNCQILLQGQRTAVQILEATSYEQAIPHIASAALIVDAMLGTGAKGNPREPLASWIAASNQSDAVKVAIDIPTGIDADTGYTAQTFFKTHYTLTFVARKPSMALPDAAQKFGAIEVLPIGISAAQIEELISENQQ